MGRPAARRAAVFIGGVNVERILVAGAVLALLSGAPSLAAEGARAPAVGAELDLLPPVISAMAGGVGLSGQLWVGQGRWRGRAVGARILFPDSIGPPSPFEDQRLTVVALIVDRFFWDGFEGPWVGAGAEYWWSTVGHEATPATSSWHTPVVTAGAGWVWKVWRGLYLNPWGAVHGALDAPAISLGGDVWEPRRISAEVSLKVGWSFGESPP